MVNFEMVKNLMYSITISVVGCLLTVMFSTLVFRLTSLSWVAPCLVAFNTAMVGFSSVDKNRNLANRFYLIGGICGLATALISFILLNIIFIYTEGGIIFDFLDLSIFIGVGIAFAEMGVLLAVKHFGAQASTLRN